MAAIYGNAVYQSNPYFNEHVRRNAAREVDLLEHLQAPDGAPLETATLITTDANALVSVHDRTQ